MSWTLLDYTQAILSSLDSDEVNSISDTVESAQVVKILRTVYEEIVARADLNEHWTLFELEASGTSTKPTKMTRPTDVHSLEWIKYNVETADDTDDNFILITFLPLEQFLNRNHMLKESADNVGSFTETIDGSSITFYYTDDAAPTCWTTFDDHTIIFDSYDAEVDSTLQKTKTLAYGKKEQTWTEDDDFVPFIDSEFSVLLLNEAKVLAFAELKQMAHQKAEMSARRLWSDTQKKKRSLDRNRDELDRLPNYGRK
jgi:hypothetical protein